MNTTDNINGAAKLLSAPGAFDPGSGVVRYISSLTSNFTSGESDVNVRSTLFRIGPNTTSGGALVDRSGARNATTAVIHLLPTTTELIEARARKVSASSGGWKSADFSAIIAHLACALGKYRFSGKLNKAELTCGKSMVLNSTKSYTLSVAAEPNSIYIPNSISNAINVNAITALIYASAAVGSSVIMDYVDVDANNGEGLVASISDSALATGCAAALNILADYYAANDAGDLFGTIFTIGLHRGVTVLGHSDEGSVNRDAMRMINFGPSHGGLVDQKLTDMTFPITGPSRKDVIGFVDGLAIQTAGLVAMSDPTVILKGKAYPTVITSSVKGDNVSKEDGLDIARKLASECSTFTSNYAKLLGRLFNTSGSNVLASRILDLGYMSLVGTVRDHLCCKVVAPYYWVEPTGSVMVDCSDMPALSSGYGYMARPGQSQNHPLFTGLSVSHKSAMTSAWDFEWRTARTQPYLQHLMFHKQDGLANLTPRKFGRPELGLVGHGGNEEMTIKEKQKKGVDVGRYLWGRGHCSMIAPAEMVYTGDSMTCFVTHVKTGEHELDLTKTHFVTEEELGRELNFSVSYLAPLDIAPLKDNGVVLSRERRDGLRALASMRRANPFFVDLAAMYPIDDTDDDSGTVDEEDEEFHDPPVEDPVDESLIDDASGEPDPEGNRPPSLETSHTLEGKAGGPPDEEPGVDFKLEGSDNFGGIEAPTESTTTGTKTKRDASRIPLVKPNKAAPAMSPANSGKKPQGQPKS